MGLSLLAKHHMHGLECRHGGHMIVEVSLLDDSRHSCCGIPT